MDDVLVINTETGEREFRPPTAEEIADAEARAAAVAEAEANPPPTLDDEVADLRAEVRDLRERAAQAAAAASNVDARAVGEAVAGPPER